MKKPRYLFWSERNVGYCNYKTKRYYFPGEYNSPESREAYEKFLTSVERGDVKPTATAPITVAELCAKFLRFAKTYYRKHGRSTGSYERFAKFVVPPLLNASHKKPAKEFSRSDLRDIRDAFVARGLCVTTINNRIGFIKQIFRWGAENDIIDAEVVLRLDFLKSLEPGRSAARDPESVRPVSDDDIQHTALYLSRVVSDMVYVLRYTAMRPGEVFELRWRDVDQKGDVWLYNPEEWKTEHHTRLRRRVVPIAATAREILKKYHFKKEDEIIFSPRDAVREHYADANGNVSERVEKRIAKTKERYNKNSFHKAIERAALRAGVKPWGPNRLRHSAATEIRAKAGLEAAQVILGHANAKTTEIYAETAVEKAIAAAALVWGDSKKDSRKDSEKPLDD